MNETKIERFRVEGMESSSVAALFAAMDGKGFSRRKFTPTTDVSHLEIYQYAAPAGDKLTLVYDTKAKILTIDARSETLPKVTRLIANPEQNAAGVTPKSAKPQPARNAASVPTQNAKSGSDDKPAQTVRSGGAKSATITPEKAPNRTRKAKGRKPEPQKPKPVTIKGVSAKRLDWIIRDLKEKEGVKAKVTTAGFDKTRAITLTSKEKEIVEVVRDERGNVSLVGEPSGLLNNLKSGLESKSDVRLLKKHIPTALRFLSESSKIDLSNGITDLANVPRLSDYSVLLMPPYRALEKFIYDLQQAENIDVKMIGQAYEKDDEGRYTLKKGYLKKIPSVIYAEVMSALYTEYSLNRNFYTHSDNSADSRFRGISDKAEAEKLLDRLLSVIEYNSKKLAEIGFAVKEDK